MDALALFDAVPPLRAALPPNLAASLAHAAEFVELKPGQELLQVKLPPPRVAFLSYGFAAYSVGASNSLVDLLPAGRWLALPFCLNANGAPLSIFALSHASVTLLPRDELMRAAYASPRLALSLALAAADDARVVATHLTAFREKSAEGRCAYLLLDLAERVYANSSFECPLDQSALASFAGLSRGTFNRALRTLEVQQLLRCERNRYRLLDVDGLKRVE